ncbi:DUF1836 domain-containing protein [Streptococcus loxodontisalivarius]|uniref:DNA-binding transcriptional MerR regulator n=1 Tax=Streptococcus loxodontisalivarius TaxID=1349415 RepID=A0ABS2PVU7_9STRE|nr:DUF1836 domain-containing protein [Streptococcus loxodontisalivarius]MBM7643650.1 DNA-binding transcriptional MerR regulator [Streptococcus loxodontisalivarius]
MTKKLPTWDELPDLELYLDQVLLMVNQLALSDDIPDDKGLTASMVNNYVKHGHIEKPIKKKYQKNQLARLIAITFLKNVFSIQEISHTLNVLHENYQSSQLYDDFVACMNDDSREVPELIETACQSLKLYFKARRLTYILEGEQSHVSDTQTQ